MKYYLVGIKGSGMSALAKLLKSMGNTVMGCDYLKHFYTEDDMADIIINDMDIEYLNDWNVLQEGHSAVFNVMRTAYALPSASR